jgi:hypothetical protein
MQMTRQHAFPVCLFAISLLAAGCQSKVLGPPRTIGVRKNPQGKILQELVCQEHQDRAGVAPGPHGLGPLSITNWCECSIREPGKPDRPLPFLRDVNPQRCRTVAGTSYWLTLSEVHDSHGNNPIRLLLFDESGIRRHKVLDYVHDWKTGGGFQIYFRDGNHKVIFHAASGFIEYDVVTDLKKACGEPVKVPDDDDRLPL